MMIINLNGQQWIDDSCIKKHQKLLTNIDHLSNIEYTMAYAMANAALLIDDDCQCAHLVKAGATSPNVDWGSREAKLSAIDESKLRNVEKVWFSMLKAT